MRDEEDALMQAIVDLARGYGRFGDRLHRLEVQTLLIECGSSWENRYRESFSDNPGDELTN